MSLCSSLEPGKVRKGKVNELFVYDNFSRVPVEEVQAGDICALTGISDIGVSVCGWVGGWERAQGKGAEGGVVPHNRQSRTLKIERCAATHPAPC